MANLDPPGPPDEIAPVPSIVRLAGLPADTLAPFAGDLGRRAAAIHDLEALLAGVRQDLTARLHAAIHDATAADRRSLLAMKRDSFNGRSLRKYRDRPDWPRALAAVGQAADDVIRLEQERAALLAAFDAAYAGQLRQESAALRLHLDDARFLRGVALSSQVLVENLPRLRRSRGGGELQHRERRLELGLLRYVSRAALKPSPFSTLTRIGLCLPGEPAAAAPGGAGGGPSAGFELLHPDRWQERSNVHLHRSLVEQLGHILLRHPPFRAALPVALNGTLDRGAEGESRFIRPARYDCKSGEAELPYVRPAQVRVRLRGPLVDWLIANAQCAVTYGDLLDALALALPAYGRAGIQQLVDELLDLGFLCIVWPWEATDLVPAARLLELLAGCAAADAGLTEIAGRLDAALARLASFAASPRPAQWVAEATGLVRELFVAAGRLSGLDPQTGAQTSTDGFFHEDVCVTGAPPSGAAAHLAAGHALAVLHDLAPLVRLHSLFSLQCDVLGSLAAAAAERWPGRTTVPLLEFVSASFPLFQDYVRYDVASRGEGSLQPRSWNPRELPDLARLYACRQEVAARLPDCLRPDGALQRLDGGALTRLLDAHAGGFATGKDFCALVQPLGAAAGGWVLNALLEGGGRMSSRYTLAMEPAMRERFTAHFARHAGGAGGRSARADRRGGGGDEAGELVDLLWPGGQMVNVHALQTPRVLITPGARLSIPAERQLPLRDLAVRLGGPGAALALIDRNGRRILPIHLGALAFHFLPSLAKLLTFFGPGEMRFGPPRAHPRRVGDVLVGERHVVGAVVYGRRSWTFATAALRDALQGLTPAAALLAANRWRLDRAIPEQVFVTERLPTGERPQRTKPQYVDFSSCHFVELLRGALERGADSMKLSEALPAPYDLPVADGRRWAAEIQLDSCGWAGSAAGLCEGAAAAAREVAVG